MGEGGKCPCRMIQLECCWFGQARVSWTGSRAVAGGAGRVEVLLQLRTRQRAEPRHPLFWEL